ncbi:MAG: arsenate reductase (glutaredoxin) [Saprospiraceae bacterium]
MKIYHNPRCSKSRKTLTLIEEHNCEIEIIKYLDQPLTIAEIYDLLKKLDMEAKDIIRRGEAIYKEHYKGKILSNNEWIEAMIKYPKLIERPIVILGDKAVLGRPPENVLKLLNQ